MKQAKLDPRTARLVSWSQSPDGVSLIQVWYTMQGLRPVYLVSRANLAGEEVTTISRRTTEEQARKRANLVWLTDKYGAAEGLRRYTEKYACCK